MIRRKHRSRLNFRPIGFRVERFEDRVVPALTTSFDAVSGLLTVSSNAADDIVLGDVNRDGIMDLNGAPISTGPGTELYTAEVSHVVVNGGPGPNNINLASVKFKEADRLSFKKGSARTNLSGPNSVDDLGLPIVINGGAGNDTITGSIFEDDIDGGSGQDKLFGGPGNDVLRCELTDLEIDGEGGINGGIVSLNGLPPGINELYCTVNLDTEQVTVLYPGLPAPTTFTRLPLLNYASIEFASIKIEIGAAGLSSGGGLKFELEEAAISGITISGIGGSSSGGDDRPTESLSFNFSKVEYIIRGSKADDRFTVTPGRSKVTIDGDLGTDSVTVNHGGYPFAQTPTEVRVATKAAVLHSNIEVPLVGQVISGDAALQALHDKGVQVTATVVKQTDKSTAALYLKCVNSSIATFDNVHLEVPPTSGQLLRSSGIGFGVIVVGGADPHGLRDLAEGANPYQPSASLTAPTMTPGTTISGTLEFVKTGHKIEILRIFVEMSDGPVRYQFGVDVTESVGLSEAAGPVALASVNPMTGQASSDADVTVMGADAGGGPLVRSKSTQIDPLVPITVPGFDHLYLSHVMVDVTSGTLEQGNASAFAATVDYAGRYVAFVSEATNLDPLVPDGNGTRDVFLRDMMMGTTKTVSFGFGAGSFQTANDQSRSPRVTGDGRFVVFESKATDMVPGLVDTNNDFDLFRYSIQTGSVECLSLNTAGTGTGDKGVFSPTVSGDGETISWLTEATDVNPGSSTGMQIVMKSKSSYNWIKHSFDKSARTLLSGDGGMLLYWTPADVSSLAGVPDTNGAFDLLAIQPSTAVVVPLSINSTKTAMGDGPTPATSGGKEVDTAWESVSGGELIVFTSSADDLLPGVVTPTTAGVFLASSTSSIFTQMTLDRIDVRPGGGFGSENSQVTISVDGTRVAWVSPVNYQTSAPPIFTADQVWSYIKLPDEPGETRLASGTLIPGSPLYEAGGLDSSNPIYTNEGLLFQSGSPLADLDTDGLVDVVLSRLDRTLTWVSPTGNGADLFVLDAKNKKITLETKSGVLLISCRIGSIGDVYIRGADNEPDSVTIDFSTGLTSLEHIVFDGGTGTGNEVSTLGQKAKQWMVNNFAVTVRNSDDSVTVIAARANDWYCDADSDKNSTIDLTLLPPGSGGGGGGSFDVALSATMNAGDLVLTRDPGTANESHFTVRLTAMPPSAVTVNLASQSSINAKLVVPAGSLPVGSKFVFTGSQDNDSIDGSLSAYSLTLDSGAGNDTITGGSHGDMFKAGSGKNVVIVGTGFGNNPDNLCLVAGGDDTVTVGDGVVGVDFEHFYSGGVSFNMDATTPQTIAPTGERVHLSASVAISVGSPYDDVIITSAGLPKITPKISKESHGRFNVSPPGGDTLIFDAKNMPTTDFGGRIVTPGMGDVVYDEYEYVNFINQAPNQVVLTTVNDEAVQRSMVNKLQTSFNFAPVFVSGNPADAFEVRTKVGGVLQPITVTTNTTNGFTHVTITPMGSASFVDGRYILRVGSPQIIGGLAGGDYTFEFHRIFGDINGDATVAANDFIQFRLALGGNNPIFDFDGDGAVAASDFIQFRLRFGGSV